MDVGSWLRGLGLERYVATFRDNGVDERVLPSLTADDLKEMGVSGVGHRRKLLDAIALLRTAGAGASPPSSDAPLVANNHARDTAERRQVTVMFCDLVWFDSTRHPPGPRRLARNYLCLPAERGRGRPAL
jgi:hypothetical protein